MARCSACGTKMSFSESNIALSFGGKCKEWQKYKNSDSFDTRLQKTPERVYENKGWDGYSFWLGIDLSTIKKR